MRFVLAIIGYGWALLGLANIVGVFAQITPESSSAILAIGLIFNMVLFVLPGLVVGFLGTRRPA